MSVYTPAEINDAGYNHDSQISVEIRNDIGETIVEGGTITLSQIDGGQTEKWSKYSHTIVMPYVESTSFSIVIANNDKL
eukprot:Awhi_evm3s2491